MSVLQIEESTALAPEEFIHSFLLRHRPVIIRCAVAHWPAIHKWSPEYLRRVVEGSKVVVKSKSDYGESGSKRHVEESRKVDFAEVVDLMTADDAPDMSYVRQTRVWKTIANLAADVGTLPYGPASIAKGDGNLWMGPAGTVAQMHWDPAHNLFAQIRGEKKWILVSPSESHMTYGNKFSLGEIVQNPRLRAEFPALIQKMEIVMNSSRNVEELVNVHLNDSERSQLYDWLSEVNNCDVNAEDPNPEKTPLFMDTCRYQSTLAAGDLMFIPYCWRHYVRSISPSVSLNWFFPPEKDFSADLKINKTLLEHLVC
jgi:hypothetical protein